MEKIEKIAGSRNQTDQARPLWTAPEIELVPVRATAADPTISDDGLGDGLIS